MANETISLIAKNGQSSAMMDVEIAAHSTMNDLIMKLESVSFVSRPDDSTDIGDYKISNLRSQTELPGNILIKDLDVQDGDVINFYPGNVVA